MPKDGMIVIEESMLASSCLEAHAQWVEDLNMLGIYEDHNELRKHLACAPNPLSVEALYLAEFLQRPPIH